MVKVVKGIMEVEESGSDLAILIYARAQSDKINFYFLSIKICMPI